MKMLRRSYITALFSLLCFSLSAQNVVLSGQVTDATSGEPLAGVTVYHTQRRTGTTTNASGQYTLTLPSNRALEIVFSYVGYVSETRNLTLTQNQQLDIQLRQDTQSLGEVQVYGTRHNFGVQSSQMSAIAVSAEQIRKMPVLLGEADVLKSLQRLPGVQSSGEGRAGIYVRGGEQDQNLFAIDGITLYNPEHLQGFTSAINADVVDDVVLYKGAFPARFGSRLSSIVDISLQEGDAERHRLSVTAGMLASRLQAEGPIWKGHTSYNIAARMSYFGAIVKPMLEEVIYDNPGQMNAYSHMRYYDMNAKLVHRFTEKDKLTGVFYLGHDVNNATPQESVQHFEYYLTKNIYDVYQGNIVDNINSSRTTNHWNNLLGGLTYTHEFSNALHLDARVSYSGYDYELGYINDMYNKLGFDQWGHGPEGAELYSRTDVENSTTYRSKVNDLGAKLELTYRQQDRHEVHAGVQVGSMELSPEVEAYYKNYQKTAHSLDIVWNVGLGDDRYKITEMERHNLLADKRSLKTYAAYAEDDWKLGEFLRANLGLRLQGYSTDGKSRLALEPRVSLRAMLAKGLSLKASYARMSQGIFLLSSGSLTSPSDIWIPLSKEMDLGMSDQLSVGLNHELRNGLQFSVEGYYKWLDGVVDYREGSTFFNETHWEKMIAQGEGKAYGVELLAQKTTGNTTGQVSYTWSKSLRTFNRPGMELNAGHEFYAPGDRRHNFNISITQRLSKNWDFSAAWTYQSGRRASFASTTIISPIPDEFNNYRPESDNQTMDYELNPAYNSSTSGYYENTYVQHLVRTNTYGQRNSYVMPAVHRLDISLTHHGSIGIGEMICDIGIYNLYNQQNISTVYWGYEKNRRVLKGVCMFPIMPSLSLTLKL
ncbi:MAG: TonB-dependent receptor [Bacteroidaceae bacterium]|nr:TonB-dependent receptor [Bacteroidaceae bacterium]